MESKIKVSKPMDLTGAHNVRDLGVYKNSDGLKLKEHQFLRGDSLNALTKEDQKRLREYGVKAVIDLRSRQEKETAPCVWEGSREVDYYSIPLLDGMNSNSFESSFFMSMSQLYIKLLEDNREEFTQALKIMSSYRDECVIFNCTAGKDRTGVTAMLLLVLAGVEQDVIAADYGASESNMKETFQQQLGLLKERGIDVPDYVFQSDSKEMLLTLEYLTKEYGSPESYIKTLNLEAEEIQVLKQKLLK